MDTRNQAKQAAQAWRRWSYFSAATEPETLARARPCPRLDSVYPPPPTVTVRAVTVGTGPKTESWPELISRAKRLNMPASLVHALERAQARGLDAQHLRP